MSISGVRRALAHAAEPLHNPPAMPSFTANAHFAPCAALRALVLVLVHAMMRAGRV
jgi:hypothetical protein